MEALLKDGERIDDLQRKGLRIIQSAQGFRFGLDALLLADFARVTSVRRIADLGTGTGILSLLLSDNAPGALIDAVELRPDAADAARRSVLLNHLEARVRVLAMDMREAPEILGCGGFDLVVCNPPYAQAGTATPSPNEARRAACYAEDLTIGEVARCGARLLRARGRMALVYPAAHLDSLMEALRENRLAPKRAQLVQDRPDSAPKLALLEAVKCGGSGMHWLPTRCLHEADGTKSAAWRALYGTETPSPRPESPIP